MAQDARIADEKKKRGKPRGRLANGSAPSVFRQLLPENVKLGYRGLRIKTCVNSARQSMDAGQASQWRISEWSSGGRRKKLLGFAITH
jgi:hypothetical protein